MKRKKRQHIKHFILFILGFQFLKQYLVNSCLMSKELSDRLQQIEKHGHKFFLAPSIKKQNLFTHPLNLGKSFHLLAQILVLCKFQSQGLKKPCSLQFWDHKAMKLGKEDHMEWEPKLQLSHQMKAAAEWNSGNNRQKNYPVNPQNQEKQ